MKVIFHQKLKTDQTFTGLQENILTFVYKSKSLTIIKPIIEIFYYEFYNKNDDFIFLSSKKTYNEKEYFKKFINEKEKEFIFFRRDDSNLYNSGLYDLGKSIYTYSISNTQFKNSFEKRIKFPEKFCNYFKNKNLNIYFRTKNIPNDELFAYNKLGISITNNENMSNKNILFTGIEINKTNEAKTFLENYLNYWNLVNKNKKQRINIKKENNYYLAPFIYYFNKNNFLDVSNKRNEVIYGLGLQAHNTIKANFKINCYYFHKIEESLDIFTKFKYKKINFCEFNTDNEILIEQEVFFLQNLNFAFYERIKY